MELCSNCQKILDGGDRIVRDGSGATAHMYPQECIRYQREQIRLLNERLDELEKQYIVKILPN